MLCSLSLCMIKVVTHFNVVQCNFSAINTIFMMCIMFCFKTLLCVYSILYHSIKSINFLIVFSLMCGNRKDKIYLSVFLCQTKLNKEIFIFNKLSKQTDLKGQHNFILFHLILILYVADSATFLASNSVLWTLISTENSLFIPL